MISSKLAIDAPDQMELVTIEMKYGICNEDSVSTVKYKFWRHLSNRIDELQLYMQMIIIDDNFMQPFLDNFSVRYARSNSTLTLHDTSTSFYQFYQKFAFICDELIFES